MRNAVCIEELYRCPVPFHLYDIPSAIDSLRLHVGIITYPWSLTRLYDLSSVGTDQRQLFQTTTAILLRRCYVFLAPSVCGRGDLTFSNARSIGLRVERFGWRHGSGGYLWKLGSTDCIERSLCIISTEIVKEKIVRRAESVFERFTLPPRHATAQNLSSAPDRDVCPAARWPVEKLYFVDLTFGAHREFKRNQFIFQYVLVPFIQFCIPTSCCSKFDGVIRPALARPLCGCHHDR